MHYLKSEKYSQCNYKSKSKAPLWLHNHELLITVIPLKQCRIKTEPKWSKAPIKSSIKMGRTYKSVWEGTFCVSFVLFFDLCFDFFSRFLLLPSSQIWALVHKEQIRALEWQLLIHYMTRVLESTRHVS